MRRLNNTVLRNLAVAAVIIFNTKGCCILELKLWVAHLDTEDFHEREIDVGYH